MKILSLFDGISCARVGIERAGFTINKYYASEIDKYAKQITQKNYPDTIQLGDVIQLDGSMFSNVDIIIGGSPCQDLSVTNKNRQGLKGNKSILFWEYMRLLKEVNPCYFILENVASMPNKDKQIITDELGVQPIMINAALVSAQNRKRLFWTNIYGVTLPQDRKLCLYNIIEDTVDDKYYITEEQNAKLKFFKGSKTFWSGKKEGAVEYPMSLFRKALTILTTENGINRSTNVIKDKNGYVRKLTPIECERLQGLPDNYTEGVSNTQRYKALGNAFNVDIIAHIVSFIKRGMRNNG